MQAGEAADAASQRCPTDSLQEVVVHCIEHHPKVNTCLEDPEQDDCACFSADEFKACAGGCWAHLEAAVCPDGPLPPAVDAAERRSQEGGDVNTGDVLSGDVTDGGLAPPTNAEAQEAEEVPDSPCCTSDAIRKVISECFKEGTCSVFREGRRRRGRRKEIFFYFV